MASAFTIAHLSDLHLTASPRDARSEPKLWGKLRGMNANLRALFQSSRELRSADAILVTGDVSDRGHAAGWEVLSDAARDAGVRDRMLVLPGNHDVCCLGLRDRPENEDLARVRAALAAMGQPTRFPWVRLLAGGQVAIFAVDSTNAGNATGISNAVGRLGENQLVRLGKLLEAHRACSVKLVALHHSPNIAAAATSRRRGEAPASLLTRKLHEMDVTDRRTLRVLCRSHGVRAVLHGHTHDDLDRRVNGVRMIGAPATTEPDGRGLVSYKLYRVGARAPYAITAERVRFLLPRS